MEKRFEQFTADSLSELTLDTDYLLFLNLSLEELRLMSSSFVRSGRVRASLSVRWGSVSSSREGSSLRKIRLHD